MLTPNETVKLRRIKDMALRGLAHQVSREDKQWVLDMAVRENKPVPAPAAAQALKEGYDISRVKTITQQTVAV